MKKLLATTLACMLSTPSHSLMIYLPTVSVGGGGWGGGAIDSYENMGWRPLYYTDFMYQGYARSFGDNERTGGGIDPKPRTGPDKPIHPFQSVKTLCYLGDSVNANTTSKQDGTNRWLAANAIVKYKRAWFVEEIRRQGTIWGAKGKVSMRIEFADGGTEEYFMVPGFMSITVEPVLDPPTLKEGDGISRAGC